VTEVVEKPVISVITEAPDDDDSPSDGDGEE
jgi:hypothetical protein